MSNKKQFSRFNQVAFILLLVVFSMSLPRVQAKESKISFDWSEETYSFTFEHVWDGTPFILNYTGSYSKEFPHYYTCYVNESDGFYYEEMVTTTYNANYSNFLNYTRTGSISMDYSLDVYKVDVSIGDTGKLIWMALKSGILDIEYYGTGEGLFVDHYEEYHQIIKKTYSKYNFTNGYMILLDTWSDPEEHVFGESNFTDYEPYQPDYVYVQEHSEFSTPIILTIQMYTTESGEKIGWANLFQDFIIYKDEDSNGIYSAGTSSYGQGATSIKDSTENCGHLTPIAEQTYTYVEYVDHNYTVTEIYPKDKSINEIASTIEFSSPTTTDGTDISWSITYPEFPINGFATGSGVSYERPHNASYAHTSPGTFSYSFDYLVNNTQADLDFTLDMPKISNDTFYEAVQGSSLALPHYNYFLSTFDIKEKDEQELTVPADIFMFESNDAIVAELNMFEKKNYTIFDYPIASQSITVEALGGSVNPILMGAMEVGANPSNLFVNLIYYLRDAVDAYASFIVQDDLYRLETQNYPVWSGEKFTHDPTLSIYYADYTSSDEVIPGFTSGIIIGVIIVITTVSVRQRKKRQK